MSRRIRSRLFPFPSFPRPIHRFVPAALALALCAVLAGCTHGDVPRNASGDRMTRDELLVHGDDMKMEGLKLKREGEAIGDDAMVDRGQQKVAQGQQLIDKANAMPKKEE